MKIILTMLLSLIVLGSMAQGKMTTFVDTTVYKGGIISGGGAYLTNEYTLPSVKYDTVVVWFKEFVSTPDTTFYQGKIFTVKSTASDKWVPGYAVYKSYENNYLIMSSGVYPNGFYYQFHDSTISGTFLYSDRKTVVKNPIIAVIQR